MITYENNKLKIENTEGIASEFTKSKLSIPVSLNEFKCVEEYDLSEENSQPSYVAIKCGSIELDLYDFSRAYQDSTDDEDYELSDEIKYEFKILSEMSHIDKVKTDSSLLSAQIKPKINGNESHLSLRRQGFFTIVTVDICIPENLFSRLADSTKKGSLNSIETVMHIDGFDLGYELGKGNCGVLIENKQNFEIHKLCTTLSNPQDTVLSALNRIDRRIERNSDNSNE